MTTDPETSAKTEAYLATVRDSVASPSGRQLVEEAIRWMRVAHRGQTRPDGKNTPYVEHPAEVAHLVVTHAGTRNAEGRLRLHDTAVVLAALLHDTVEDQPQAIVELSGLPVDPARSVQQSALEGISARFGADAARLVGLLTSPAVDERTLADHGLTAESAKPAVKAAVKAEVYRAHVLTLLAYEPRAALVKLADMSTNALAVGNLPMGPKREKLRLKYLPTLRALHEALAQLPEAHPVAAWAPELRRRFDEALRGPYATTANA